MRIGQISRKTGLSKDTIRYYEKLELIFPKESESDWNNYKEYDEQLLERLELIKKAKGFGFTLNEIKEFVELVEQDGGSCMFWDNKVSRKVQELDKKIQELTELRNSIVEKASQMKANCKQKDSNDICPQVNLNSFDE